MLSRAINDDVRVLVDLPSPVRQLSKDVSLERVFRGLQEHPLKFFLGAALLGLIRSVLGIFFTLEI